MNKTELIAEVAKKCSLPKKDAEKAINATFDTIADAVFLVSALLKLLPEIEFPA